MKNFALMGAAGYIGPKHMKAIQDTGNNLVAALDKHDNVGILDSYFPETAFFTEFERFDRHIDKLRRKREPIDYISICTPNYLHDAHIRFALRQQAHAICEKPLVLNPWNVEALQDFEKEYGKKIFTILQLRLHPDIIALKKQIETSQSRTKYDVDLTYLTSRGSWYYTSWKGDIAKSGGIATNIGIHFFDILTWIFGSVLENTVHLQAHDRAAGFLELESARVRWFLSISFETIPEQIRKTGKRTYRSITVNGTEIEFSTGFADLHTISYQHIVEDHGFGLNEAKPSVLIAHEIRNARGIGLKGEFHPFAKLPVTRHPFDV